MNIPQITSQCDVCPIPFKLDTYSMCPFGCVYCFARKNMMHNRRISNSKKHGTVAINVDAFERWVSKVIDSGVYTNSAQAAFLDRMPLKIGGNCDPFPPIEIQKKITYRVLKLLHGIDYPVQMLTKNPNIMTGYYKDFMDPNWVIGVSLISTDDAFLSKIEPSAPSFKNRISSINTLANMGAKVFIKIQPAIYPYVMSALPDLIRAIKNAGAFGFNIEGLKIKPADTFADDLNVRSYYTNRIGIDYYLHNRFRLEYIKMANELAKQYDLLFYCADNYVSNFGAGSECCGTTVLRNYTINPYNEKTKKFNDCKASADRFVNCKMNHAHRVTSLSNESFQNYEKNRKGFGL